MSAADPPTGAAAMSAAVHRSARDARRRWEGTLFLAPLMAIHYAHLVMLADRGIVSPADAHALRDALDSISVRLSPHGYTMPRPLSVRIAARYGSRSADWTMGPSSQSSPSHRSPSTMPATMSHDDRSASVSSMRRTKVPPCRRANSQLKSAVRAPPMWRYPVGDGANRTRAIPRL